MHEFRRAVREVVIIGASNPRGQIHFGKGNKVMIVITIRPSENLESSARNKLYLGK